MSSLDIRNFTRRKPPVFPYQKIVATILPGWEISLVFAGTTRAPHLNTLLRNKSYTPNALSYSPGKKSGEIIICLDVAKKQAPEYGLSYPHFVVFLFIHGLLHLKGRAHGTTMERHERTFLKRFTGATVSYGSSTTHRDRH